MNFKDMPPPHKELYNKRGRAYIEKDVEEYGRKKCHELGWMCEKFTSPQKRSVPDRIITAHVVDCMVYINPLIFFIEFKKPKEYATKLQQIDHAERRAMGCLVMCVDCFGQMDVAIQIAKHTLQEGRVPELPVWLMK